MPNHPASSVAVATPASPHNISIAVMIGDHGAIRRSSREFDLYFSGGPENGSLPNGLDLRH
jgi:hypothetical protein